MPAPLSLSRFSIGFYLQGWDSEEIKANSWWVKPFGLSSPGEALTWVMMGDEGLYSGTSVFIFIFSKRKGRKYLFFSVPKQVCTKLDSLQINNKNNFKTL